MSIEGQGHFSPYIFQVLYVLCFTRPRYQVSVYRTIGPLVLYCFRSKNCCQHFVQLAFELFTKKSLFFVCHAILRISKSIWMSLNTEPKLLKQISNCVQKSDQIRSPIYANTFSICILNILSPSIVDMFCMSTE